MEYQDLTINSAKPQRQCPEPPMFPGGMLIDQEEEQAVLEVLRSRRLFRYYGPQPGPSKVEQLEAAFAKKMGSPHALAVTSGTAALVCALQGIGIGPGDEVIIPAYTWMATASAVLALGAVPILAEVDDSLTLDPVDCATRITPYTRAIIPVHLRGVPCQMDELLGLASAHGIRVVEDVAQADGGSFKGRRLGSIGDAGCFSFQFNKILTCGEGGMVLTSHRDAYQRALMFHDVIGGARNQIPAEQIIWGINFRMTELQAAIMLVQLNRLEGLLERMRHSKQVLSAGLQEIARRKPITLQRIPDPAGDASISQIIFLPDAEMAKQVYAALRAENLNATILYQPDVVDYHVYTHWLPVVQQRAWNEASNPWKLARRSVTYTPETCPKTLDLLSRAVHLNVNPLYTDQDLEEILDTLNQVLTTSI